MGRLVREDQDRIKRRAGTGDVIVGICCRLPDEEVQADESFCRQTGAASHSQTLILMGDFNHSDICWGTAQQAINNPGGSWSVLMILL